MILLDTDVLSELMKAYASPILLDRLTSVPQQDIFISAMTRSEILYGLAVMPESRNAKAKALVIAEVLKLYDDRCLSLGAGTASILADIRAEAQSRGYTLPLADAVIAATALQHNLQLLTGNLRHFEGIPKLQLANPL